jgi:DNA repair exonuclease SbcCD ATPase subunit
MNILLLILAFLLIVSCTIFFITLLKRNEKISQLEKMLDQAGRDASSSKRSLESYKETHESEREHLHQAESKLSKLMKEFSETEAELKTCKQSIEDKDAQIEKMAEQIESLEPASKRAREAEDKLLALQKESVSLRSEYAQAHKRVEAAESAARDKQIQFERVEATLEAKDKALIVKQQESADLARELDARRTEISELVIERDKLLSMETALNEKLSATEESFKKSERDRQQLTDEFTECRLELAENKEKLEHLKQMFDEQAAAGENDVEQLQRLRDQLLETETKLKRKEAALKDLEQVHADSTRETPYEAHKHMEWTLNHFDPKALTFKFNNMGAKVFLVDVQTNIPQLRYEFETGREVPSGSDAESRIRVAIKKSEQRNMEELPGEFDMTVFYALNIYPIQFKIRPNEGQKIERIK